MPNWEIDRQDFDLLVKVAKRALRDLTDYPDDQRTLVLDLNACHSNGCPLDFRGLLAASLGDLSHDICGIRTHINRDTGKLEDFFTPRYALANRSKPDPNVFLGGHPVAVENAMFPPEDSGQKYRREFISGRIASLGPLEETEMWHRVDAAGLVGIRCDRSEMCGEQAAWGSRTGPPFSYVCDYHRCVFEATGTFWKDAPGQQQTTVIDLTPRGCTTPEGNARVAAAMKQFDDTAAALANACMQFLNDWNPLLRSIIRDGGNLSTEDRFGLGDSLDQLMSLAVERKLTQEEFLRSVAGAPPAPQPERKEKVWVSIDGEEYTQDEADALLQQETLIEACSHEDCPHHYHKLEGIADADLLGTLERLNMGPVRK